MSNASSVRPRAAGAGLAALLLAAVATLALPVAAHAGTPPVDASGTPLPSLAPIVKRAAPAIVSIATRGTVAEHGQRNPMLEDPFLRRFFGVPEQGERPRQFQAAGSGVVSIPSRA